MSPSSSSYQHDDISNFSLFWCLIHTKEKSKRMRKLLQHYDTTAFSWMHTDRTPGDKPKKMTTTNMCTTKHSLAHSQYATIRCVCVCVSVLHSLVAHESWSVKTDTADWAQGSRSNKCVVYCVRVCVCVCLQFNWFCFLCLFSRSKHVIVITLIFSTTSLRNYVALYKQNE